MSICIVGLIVHLNSLFYAFVIIVSVTNDISQVLEALNCFECFMLEEAKGVKKIPGQRLRRQEQSAVEESCGCPMFRCGMMGLSIDMAYL